MKLSTLFLALTLVGCSYEVTDMVDTGRSTTGKLGGWSRGGIINPPNSLNKDPAGENNITLQCNLDPPGVYTVQFEIDPPESANNADNKPVATIEWATNGNTARRKISVYNGATISGPAEFVKVKAFDDSTSILSGPYAIGIVVTPGTRGGTIIPTLQPGQETVNSTASVTIDVPQDAGAVLVRFLLAPLTATATVDSSKYVVLFIDGAGNTIGAYQDPILSEFVQIPPGAVQITVQNNDSVNARIVPIFGIDG